MIDVLRSAWALLLGILLLMVGNGLQGSLIGVRGAIENFTTLELSVISSAYFAGFLIGSRIAPELIRKVGHVRVFAALGSFISAVLILYPTITTPWAWVFFRIVFGFSFSGVYVTAESWLNNASTNETRGKALSLYMIVQMIGIISAQGILALGDPAGFVLFIIPSVLVSIAFAPILLTVTPTPSFETSKPMTLRRLYDASPTGIVGMMIMGGAFAAQFGMASIYASAAGLDVTQISLFVAAIFLGGLVMQYPTGWLSDRMDRRVLILALGLFGAVSALLGWLLGGVFEALLVAAFLTGGVANPLYALLIAYTNDFLTPEEMPSAAGGLIFANGLGAITGPILTGWFMSVFGPAGFWIYLFCVLLALSAWVGWRMTRRASPYAEQQENYDAVSYAAVTPSSTAIAVAVAQEFYADNQEAAEGGGRPPG